MFEKNLMLSYLVDFYGDVLDENTRTAMRAYYDDDLSLAEIARTVGISRQGVRHVIKRGEEQLLFLEERLGLAQRQTALDDAAEQLNTIKDKLLSSDNSELRDIADEISKISESISERA